MIKRFRYDFKSGIVADGKGDFISYAEYEALQQKLVELTEQRDALVVESAVILQDRAVILEAFDDTCVDIGMRRGEMAENYPTPETPATDAARASLRAEGVEMFAEHLSGMGIMASETSVKEFARQLRESKGAQS